MRQHLGLLLSVSGWIFVGACGGDGAGSASMVVTAAEGGTVQVSGEETRLEIPPGALAEDTEIVLSIASLSDYPALEHGRDRVLVIEPDGLVLSAPAELLFDPGAPDIASDDLVSIR